MINKEKAENSRSIVGILFGLIFFSAGSFFLYIGALKPLSGVFSSQNWVQKDCYIRQSKLSIQSDSDGTTYRADIKMEWVFENLEYLGGSYNFSDMHSSGRSGKQKIVNKYQVGSQHRCWINPSNPAQAVLNRDIPGSVYFIVPFTAIFILIGGVAMFGSFGVFPNSWVPAFRSRHKRVASTGLGYSELKPEHGPKTKMFGALLFAVFWNGITSIFVYHAVQSHLRGDPEWFLTIFIIPFVLVGVGTMGFVAYTFLSLFNPKPSLRLSEGRPILGQNVTLQWGFDKPVNRIKSLQLSLVGEERATYQQGTSTVTDKHIFYKHALKSSSISSEIANGSVSLQAPENSMHSFDSGNNKIVWYVELHGKIGNWPDVKEKYPLTIRPRR